MNARSVFHVAPNGAWLGLLVQPYKRVAPNGAPALQRRLFNRARWLLGAHCQASCLKRLHRSAAPTHSKRPETGL